MGQKPSMDNALHCVEAHSLAIKGALLRRHAHRTTATFGYMWMQILSNTMKLYIRRSHSHYHL
jgi:hypothetical protein